MAVAEGILGMAFSQATLASFLLAFAFFSGCADDAPLDAAPIAPMAPPMPDALLAGGAAFSWDAAGGIPTTGADVQVGSSNAMTIDVPEGAKSLKVTATWTCATPTCDLHYYLDRDEPAGFPPSPASLRRSGEHAMGSSPLTLTIDAPPAGTYWASVHADALTVDVVGSFAYEILVPALAEAMPAEMGEHDHAAT